VATENASGPCTTCYFSYDHLGSVRLVTDQSGLIVARHDYLPYGEEVSGYSGRTMTGFSVAGTAPNDAAQKFTGQVRDQESGMDYFNARYLTPVYGRFNSPDPQNAGASLLSSQSWNGYAYVGGNPLNSVDPSGMEKIDPCGNNQNCITVDGGAPDPLNPWSAWWDSGFVYPCPTCNFSVSGTGVADRNPKPVSLFPPSWTLPGLPPGLSVPTGMSPAGLAFLVSCEAYRGGAYNDSRGNCTIGYGHLLHHGPCSAQERSSLFVDPSAAFALFTQDVHNTADLLNASLMGSVNQQQYDALLSLAFNMGAPGLQTHDVWTDVAAGNLAAAPAAIRSLSAGGAGIPFRRANEANIFSSGAYPSSCYSHQ